VMRKLRLGPRVRGLLMVAPPVLVIAIFVGLSIVACVLYTLGYAGGINSTVSTIALHQNVGFPTGRAYSGELTDPEFLASLRATIGITLATTLVVVALAWCMALWLRTSNSRIARWITALSVVPLFIPGVIGAYAILQFYAPNGFPRTLAEHLGWGSAPSFGYTLTGVVTTAIFWGFEFGFDQIFQSKDMRYLGGLIGLAIGYWTKYRLDKRYVFGPQTKKGTA